MRDKGFILYPGKLTKVETFRVGCIGAIGPDEMRQAVQRRARHARGDGHPRREPAAAGRAGGRVGRLERSAIAGHDARVVAGTLDVDPQAGAQRRIDGCVTETSTPLLSRTMTCCASCGLSKYRCCA